MNDFSVETELFRDRLLEPLCKFNLDDKQASLHLKSKKLRSFTFYKDRSVLGAFVIEAAGEAFDEVVIKDVDKIKSIMQQIGDPTITLSIDKGALKYDGPEMKFRSPLIDSKFFNMALFRQMKKLQAREKVITFKMNFTALDRIKKSYGFVSDVENAYIFTKDGKVWVSFHNPKKKSINTMSFIIAESYEGDGNISDAPLHFSFFRDILLVKKGVEYTVGVVEAQLKQGVPLFTFSSGGKGWEHQYITTISAT